MGSIYSVRKVKHRAIITLKQPKAPAMKFNDFWKNIFKPYRTYIFCMFLTGAMWGLFSTISPYLLKVVIDILSANKPISDVYLPALGYFLVYAASAINFRIDDWIRYKIMPVLKKDIATEMFNYIKHHSHNFFLNNFAGSMGNKVTDMVVNLELLLNVSNDFIANALALIFAIIVMYTVNPMFALTLFTWCILFFLISILFSDNIHKLSKKTSESYSKYSGDLIDILSNIPSVRLFSRFRFETKNLNNSIDELVTNDRAMLGYIIKMRIVQDATFITLIGMMIYLLIKLYSLGKVTIGDFALILTITISIFQSMWFLASRIVDVYKSIGKCLQAMSMMEISHEIQDVMDASKISIKHGQITFKDVSFAYNSNQEIFKKLNVEIKPGTKVGLVGYSGSGKSTFINLMLRYFEVKSGSISIDGQDINTVTQESLRESISMIPQDISLFHRSLLENICYGNTDATEEQIIQASKLAHCHEFINNLPEGYATLVGERGIKLSGGQRQRIAIARAFLENAPLLILDEATSSLDSVTEKYIQESLHLAIQNRTTIIIAHRLSTLLEVDRILVFNDGQIIEDGRHQDLLKLNGHYAKMWAMQCDGFLPS